MRKDLRGVLEESAFCKAVRLGHAAILQRDQAVLHDAKRNLVLDLVDRESGRVPFDDEALDLVVRRHRGPDDP